MRVNVDSRALRDPRFRKMATTLGTSRQEALGLCIEVWMQAYEQRSEFMTVDDVDCVVERFGTAAAMVAARLASVAESKADAGDRNTMLRLHGVADRIGFLVKQAERGRAGGRARAKAHGSDELEANAKQTLQANAKPTPNRHPSDQAQALVPDQPQSQHQTLDQTQPASPASARAERARSGAGELIGLFRSCYQQKYGHACTVTTKAAGQLQQLLKHHDAGEVKRRMEILFESPPPFLATNAPDIGVLVQHFDKLVAPSAPRNGRETALSAVLRMTREDSVFAAVEQAALDMEREQAEATETALTRGQKS